MTHGNVSLLILIVFIAPRRRDNMHAQQQDPFLCSWRDNVAMNSGRKRRPDSVESPQNTLGSEKHVHDEVLQLSTYGVPDELVASYALRRVVEV